MIDGDCRNGGTPAPNEMVSDILNITGFDTLLDMAPSLSVALARAAKSSSE